MMEAINLITLLSGSQVTADFLAYLFVSGGAIVSDKYIFFTL